MSGTTLSQAIPIAISPILTRLYTPEDFGVFALYMSLLVIVSSFVTGRYELAILLPKNDDDVKGIVKLVVMLLSFSCLLLWMIVFFFNQSIARLFDHQEIAEWLYFFPISIFFIGLYQVYYYLLLREKRFQNLSINKVIVSATNSTTQIVCGMSTLGGFGLLCGSLLSYILSIIILMKHSIVSHFFDFQKVSIVSVAKEYRNYPMYDVPAVLMNNLSNQLPLLALGKFFGFGIVGAYSLMTKVLMIPIGLVSSGIVDVFKQRAIEDYNTYGNCRDIYVKTFKSLFIIGGIPFGILGFFAPELFAFVFGETWRKSGEFAQIMIPMMYLQFVISPLSYVLYIANKQKYDFYGQIFLLMTVLIAIACGLHYQSEIILLTVFSIGYANIYLVYLAYSYYLSNGDKL